MNVHYDKKLGAMRAEVTATVSHGEAVRAVLLMTELTEAGRVFSRHDAAILRGAAANIEAAIEEREELNRKALVAKGQASRK